MNKEEFMLAVKKIMNRIATDEDKLAEINPLADELINFYLHKGLQDAEYDRSGT